MKDVVFPFGKRPPRFNLNLVFNHELLRLVLLMERVGFYLVNGRHYLIMNDQVHQPVRMKIAYTNGPYLSFFVKLFHSPPLTIYIPERLVNKIQVEVI